MKDKTITSEILLSYSQCSYKAYLLLCTRKKGALHEYVRILEGQRRAVQRKFVRTLRQKNDDVRSFSPEALNGKHNFLVNATLNADGLSAGCAILSKVRTHSALGRHSYEPTIVVSACSIRKEHKLEMFFVSHVLEQVQDKRPISGKIVSLDGKSHSVMLGNGSKTLIPFLEPLQEWAAADTPEPPSLILNKQCPSCQFHDLCRAKAVQEDHLSLQDGISTRKAINKYEKKGIFTVKQLSYTFRPRKRRKRAKNPPPVLHKPELQALAIRTEKIYLQSLPELTRQPVELFLDIEGVPDRQFTYLIGLLICENDTTIYNAYWADAPDDEAQMWQQFLDKVSQYPDAPIYHYGSFDARTLTKLAKRYDTDAEELIQQLVNVNKHIFGKVYFPIYSNRLKEIGAFIGATWTASNASGLQSLVWRHHWDETRSAEYKDLLLTYNDEDCRALKLLADELSKIKHSADTLSEVDFATQPKRRATKVGEEIHSQFEEMLKFAHANYDKKKISFRSHHKDEREKKKIYKKRGYQPYLKMPRANKIIQVLPKATCSRSCHKEKEPLCISKKVVEHIIINFVSTKGGVKKFITKYEGKKAYCQKCNCYYSPPDIVKLNHVLYGHGFKAWVVYHRVALRLSYGLISEALEEQFDEEPAMGSMPKFVKDLARHYTETEKLITQHLLESPFIHVDETPINIQGSNQYVWVFTDGKYVIFKLSETREAMIAHTFLATYNGILISDFYPGYDSIQCKQQKCWSHLIHDLNNDLWSHPFDAEYEFFVLEVNNMLKTLENSVHKAKSRTSSQSEGLSRVFSRNHSTC